MHRTLLATCFAAPVATLVAALAYGLTACEKSPTGPDLQGLATTCGSATQLTTSPVPLASIQFLIPLGNLNPPAHTAPTDHIYFWMAPASSSRLARCA